MARGERQEDGDRAGVSTISRPARGARPAPSGDELPAGRSELDAPVPILGRPQRPPQDPGRRPDAAPRAAARPGPRTPSAVPVGQRPGPAPAGPARTSGPLAAVRPAGPQAAVRTTGPQAAVRTTGPLPAGSPAPSQAPAPGQPAVPSRPAALPARPAEPSRPGPALIRSAGRRATASHRMPFVLLLCGLLGGALVCALVISTTLAEGSFQITKLQNSTSALTRQKQVLQEEVAQQESPQVIAQEAAKLGLQRPQELLFFDLKTGKTSSDGPAWSGAVNAPGYAP